MSVLRLQLIMMKQHSLKLGKSNHVTLEQAHSNYCNTLGTVIANFITSSWLRFTPSKATTTAYAIEREDTLFEMSNFYLNCCENECDNDTTPAICCL